VTPGFSFESGRCLVPKGQEEAVSFEHVAQLVLGVPAVIGIVGSVAVLVHEYTRRSA